MGTRSCGSTLCEARAEPGAARSRRRRPRRRRAGDLATNDVFWDEVVVDRAALGEQEVYDATVLGTHNFVADGIAVHNSIEQDADMVILLHREDAYERESPRAGEADFIVAKHRNGPTAHGHGRVPGPLLPLRGHGELSVDIAAVVDHPLSEVAARDLTMPELRSAATSGGSSSAADASPSRERLVRIAMMIRDAELAMPGPHGRPRRQPGARLIPLAARRGAAPVRSSSKAPMVVELAS